MTDNSITRRTAPLKIGAIDGVLTPAGRAAIADKTSGGGPRISMGGAGALVSSAYANTANPKTYNEVWLENDGRRFADENLGWVYLAFLQQERSDVAHALDALTSGGVHIPVITGLDELIETAPGGMERRARVAMALVDEQDLRAWT